MSDDGKQPMQAPGPGDNPKGGNEGAGESGGGPYPNPHTGEKPDDGLPSHGDQISDPDRHRSRDGRGPSQGDRSPLPPSSATAA